MYYRLSLGLLGRFGITLGYLSCYALFGLFQEQGVRTNLVEAYAMKLGEVTSLLHRNIPEALSVCLYTPSFHISPHPLHQRPCPDMGNVRAVG